MNFEKIALVLFGGSLLLLSMGCAAVDPAETQIPFERRAAKKAYHGGIVNLSAEKAYQKTLNYLLDMGAVPTFRDKELLLIKTDPFPVRLATNEADCGSMFGIPYLKDKRVKTAVTYQVRIKEIDHNSSHVDVRVTVSGYMDINEGAPFFIEKTHDKRALTCHSKGVLEQHLIKALTE